MVKAGIGLDLGFSALSDLELLFSAADSWRESGLLCKATKSFVVATSSGSKTSIESETCTRKRDLIQNHVAYKSLDL